MFESWTSASKVDGLVNRWPLHGNSHKMHEIFLGNHVAVSWTTDQRATGHSRHSLTTSLEITTLCSIAMLRLSFHRLVDQIEKASECLPLQGTQLGLEFYRIDQFAGSHMERAAVTQGTFTSLSKFSQTLRRHHIKISYLICSHRTKLSLPGYAVTQDVQSLNQQTSSFRISYRLSKIIFTLRNGRCRSI